MDIRGFFGGSSKGSTAPAVLPIPSSSALEKISKEKERKTPSTPKKRSEKVKAKGSADRKSVDIEAILLESDSDGESPIPSSLRKTAMDQKKKKRTRVLLSSDSDDEFVPKSAEKRSSPQVQAKSKTKRAKIVVSDESASPSASPKKHGKTSTSTTTSRKPSRNDEIVEEEDSDVEMISGTDSENEFVEIKKPKKKDQLLPGQKKLSFAQSKATSAPKKDDSKSKASVRQHVQATDFFGSGGNKAPSKPSSVTEKVAASRHSTSRRKSTSPSPKKARSNQEDKLGSKVSPKKTKEKTVSPPQKENLPKTVEKVKEQPPVEAAVVPPRAKTTPQKEKVSSGVSRVESTQKQSVPPTKQPTPVQARSEKSAPPKAVPSKSTTEKSSPPVTPAVDPVLPWVDKYKPMKINQLVGQNGDKSPMNKLMGWLKDWAKHNLGEGGKQKKAKPAPWATGQDGTPFKAALLSGSPGVGKTTCAYLACQTLGFNVVEMNASDVRNKKHLEAQVAQLTGSHQIEEYFKSSTITGGDEVVHHVLIMDEVDGMSGNEDRAGISELIQIIKDTKIPIICICNDRSHPKMRSLVNHCFDLRFPKPRLEQIRARIMYIASIEKMKITKEQVDEIIELSGHDVRQIIYNLQMRGGGDDERGIEKKNCAINTFDAARRLLDSRASLMEKQEMFFVDYGIMPLFVQENYPNMKNDKHKPSDALAGLRKASDLISMGDLFDRCIRSTGAWKLLNEQCMMGCALPSLAVDGHLRSMIQFPAWLGKQSTAGKRQRLMRQLASHAHLKISADTKSLVTDYVPVLRDRLTRPLLHEENAGVPAVVATMTEYDLLKDDSEAIAELAVWPGKIDPGSKIQSKVKAALTRALNKEHRMLPYAVDEISKGRAKKKAAAGPTEVEVDEDGNLVERLGDDAESDEGEEEEEKAVAVVKTKTAAAAGRGRGGARGRGGRGRGKAA